MKRLEELGISPAPWTVSPRDNTIVTTHNGYRVAAGCCERYDGGRENARLIAAAPKLFECLREAVLEMCHECLSCGGYPSYECKDPNDRCFLAKWRAALAEAAGEEVRDGQSS